MFSQCELKEQSAQPVLSIRTRAAVQDLPQVFGKVYAQLAHYLGELGEKPSGMPFGAYYNMDMQNLDLEIGFPVARKLPDKGEMKASEIAAGKYATCLYTGPYTEMQPVYTALM